MNIDKHPLLKRMYDLSLETENLPASEQQTKIVTMISEIAREIEAFVDSKQPSLEALDEMEVKGVILKYCDDLNIHFMIGNCGTSGASTGMAKAIVSRFGTKPLPSSDAIYEALVTSGCSMNMADKFTDAIVKLMEGR